MKIGIIKHLNARPLTYGFEKIGNHEIVSDNPAKLVELLVNGKLDAALISSVEVFRNSEKLACCERVGVSANKKVRSIVFYKNKKESYPPKTVRTDSGSRTSVALLKLLLRLETGTVVDMVPTPPEKISEYLQNQIGSHLLFGDNALLDFSDDLNFDKIDLATWWNRVTGLPFCFALWAFPRSAPIEDSFFLSSLNYGMSRIDEIVENEKRFPQDLTRTYLQDELHFELTSHDRDALMLFRSKCEEFRIL